MLYLKNVDIINTPNTKAIIIVDDISMPEKNQDIYNLKKKLKCCSISYTVISCETNKIIDHLYELAVKTYNNNDIKNIWVIMLTKKQFMNAYQFNILLKHFNKHTRIIVMSDNYWKSCYALELSFIWNGQKMKKYSRNNALQHYNIYTLYYFENKSMFIKILLATLELPILIHDTILDFLHSNKIIVCSSSEKKLELL